MANNPTIDSIKVREHMLFTDLEIKPMALVGGKTCRTCAHRKRYALNEFSSKVIHCCELQPSKRSNSGLKTIKVTDVACGNYSESD